MRMSDLLYSVVTLVTKFCIFEKWQEGQYKVFLPQKKEKLCCNACLLDLVISQFIYTSVQYVVSSKYIQFHMSKLRS
jgi:hypothetical protein